MYVYVIFFYLVAGQYLVKTCKWKACFDLMFSANISSQSIVIKLQR